MVGSVFVDDIIHDPATALIIKINIDIGHGYPVRIQETLKKEVVLHRVDVGNGQTVRYNRACCGTPSRSHGDVHVSCFADKVLYNQKISWVSRIFDDFQFKVYPFPDFVGKFTIPLFGTFVGNVPQIGILASIAPVNVVLRVFKFLRNTEFGQQDIARKVIGLHLVHNFLDVENSFGKVFEEFLHLIG